MNRQASTEPLESQRGRCAAKTQFAAVTTPLSTSRLTSPEHLQMSDMEMSYNFTHVEADLWLHVASPRPKTINHDAGIHNRPR